LDCRHCQDLSRGGSKTTSAEASASSDRAAVDAKDMGNAPVALSAEKKTKAAQLAVTMKFPFLGWLSPT